MTNHSVFSASSAHRWLRCSGSINAEADLPNISSKFAEEGTAAHQLAELTLTNDVNTDHYLDHQLTDSHVATQEMVNYVQTYIDYVRSIDGTQFYEQKVSYENLIDGGFGTSDAIVIKDDTLYVIDLKYGMGLKVDAFENEQAMLYALGAINDFGHILSEVTTVRMVIVQPRLDHISEHSIGIDELQLFGESVKEKSKLCLDIDAKRTAGDKQCKFCRAKPTCPALKQLAEDTLKATFDDLTVIKAPITLTDNDLRLVLENKKLIISWLESVEVHVFNKITKGDNFEGYKIVEGRSLRSWFDDKSSESILKEMLGDDAFVKKIVSVAQAEKLIPKPKFKELESLIEKPKGKPTLVTSDDKRPSITYSFEIVL
jgi:hypothetical protein